MPAKETIEITKYQFNKLISDQRKLRCLEACGVYMWSGYREALDMFNDEFEE